MTTREIELELQNRELIRTQRQLTQSRLRYADLFDFAPIGYVTLDAECKIAEMNLALARLLAGTPHHFMGVRFETLLLLEDQSRFRQHIERCRRSSLRAQMELRLVPHGGEPVTVELNSVAGREMEHGKLQYRCAIVNISDRKAAEDALRRSQAELELRANHHFLSEASAVFSASLDYETAISNVVRMSIPRLADCCVVDIVQTDGRLSRAAVAHLDHSKEDLLWHLGKLPQERNQAFGKAKVVRTGRSELYANVTDSLLSALAQDADHLRILRELACLSYICVPLSIRGNIFGAAGFMKTRPGQPYTLADLALAEEFADRAAVAIDNAMLYKKEQEANRLKDEFLSIVSHELKTPLTPILGAMYRLRCVRSDDLEVQKAANMVERNAKRQADIIDDLLNVSKVASGKFDLNYVSGNLPEVLKTAVEVARPAAEAQGISVDIVIDEGIQPIRCDPERIHQALWNLISNAIKFSPPGGHIWIAARSLVNVVQIVIEDQGEGIPAEFLPHIFDPFRQAGQFVTRKHGGLGLGLSIVKHIVQQHGGAVRAESPGPGKGSRFVIELPYPKGGSMRKEEDKQPDGRPADVVKLRRQLPKGQLHNNLEEPAEEGNPNALEPLQDESLENERRTA
jgi:PAS domain S-box-containing protein